MRKYAKWRCFIFQLKLSSFFEQCSPKVRHLTLEWIGEVLHSNADRGKLWHQNSQMGALMGAGYVSDGFMLNLSSVLLRFCLPFTTNKSGGVMNEKMHKLDFSYLSREVHTPEQSNNSNIHLREGWKETMLAAGKQVLFWECRGPWHVA